MNTDYSILYEQPEFSSQYKVPAVVVPFLFEIMMVHCRQKPACRLTVMATDIETVKKYLDSLQLHYYILFKKRTADSYLQYAIQIRHKLLQTERVYVYVSVTQRDVYSVFKTDALEGCYEEVGRLLGYPTCCIKNAVTSDTVVEDPVSGSKKQTYLCNLAIDNSDQLDYRCNNLLAASNLSQHYPTNIISHYPCHFACSATIAYADLSLSLIKRLYSRYYPLLIELLQFDIIHWSDKDLGVDEIGEFNAVAFQGGSYDPAKKMLTGIQQCINICCSHFPSDSILLDVQEVLLSTPEMIFKGTKAITLTNKLDTCLLNWRKQQVFHLA